jgi:hypothetical protein
LAFAGILAWAYAHGRMPVFDRKEVIFSKKKILNHPNLILLLDVHQQFEIKGGKL